MSGTNAKYEEDIRTLSALVDESKQLPPSLPVVIIELTYSLLAAHYSLTGSPLEPTDEQ